MDPVRIVRGNTELFDLRNQLFDISATDNEAGDLEPRSFGEFGAQENIGTNVINSGSETLECQRRLIHRQRKLPRADRQLCQSQCQQRNSNRTWE